jgi:polyhydroxybutyrate depolymerase
MAITDAQLLAASGTLVAVPEAAIVFRLLEGWPAGRAWNVPGAPLPGETGTRQEPDDVGFLRVLIDRLVSLHRADPARIHLRGYSGGARLAAHAAMSIPGRIASICCVAGVRFPGTSGTRGLPPLLAIHGERDIINPYLGGNGPRWTYSVPEAVRRWAMSTECEAAQLESSIDSTVREISYARPDGSHPVRLTVIAAGTHAWPGTRDRQHCAQFGAAGTFSASDAHWRFMREVENCRTGTPHSDM